MFADMPPPLASLQIRAHVPHIQVNEDWQFRHRERRGIAETPRF